VLRVRRRQCKANDTVPMMRAQAQRHLRRDPKMRIINVLSSRTISEIKLKRTDTTLDLSQKAKLENILAKEFKCRGCVGFSHRAGKGRRIPIVISSFIRERKISWR
jgi:hypothetical protein